MSAKDAILKALTERFAYIDIRSYGGCHDETWEEIAEIAAKAAGTYEPVTVGIGSPAGDLFIVETGETVTDETELYVLRAPS